MTILPIQKDAYNKQLEEEVLTSQLNNEVYLIHEFLRRKYCLKCLIYKATLTVLCFISCVFAHSFKDNYRAENLCSGTFVL